MMQSFYTILKQTGFLKKYMAVVSAAICLLLFSARLSAQTITQTWATAIGSLHAQTMWDAINDIWANRSQAIKSTARRKSPFPIVLKNRKNRQATRLLLFLPKGSLLKRPEPTLLPEISLGRRVIMPSLQLLLTEIILC